MERQYVEKMRDEVSGLLAELFDLSAIRPPVEMFSREEAKEHGLQPLSQTVAGTIIIVYEKSRDLSETEILQHLAAESGHLYFRIAGGDNMGEEVVFDPEWIYRSRLRHDRGFRTLIFPHIAAKDCIIPRGKVEAVDHYCQLHVLRSFGKHEEAEEYDKDSERWPEDVKDWIEKIRIGVEQQARGNYELLVNFYRSEKRKQPVMLAHDPLEGRLVAFVNKKHPAKVIEDIFYFLFLATGNWLAKKYADRIGTSDGFRQYVRTQVVPVTDHDIAHFRAHLPELNGYLQQNKAYTLRFPAF